ncbi:MAG: hypothetical protein ACTHNY_02615 [Solirubrobacterales bacterium]
MSILDDAIREHLELKRAHGADEAELKRLEDEAFGPPGRPEEPDPFAEAPTEFMATPDVPGEAGPAESSGGRRINIADLQEPPPPERVEEREQPRVEATDAIEPEAEAAPLAPAEDAGQAAPPAEEDLPLAEESPAMEHEIVVEPAEDLAPEPAAEAAPGEETQERHAIAEQPTELFDIEAEMGTEDAPAEPAAEIQASRTEPLADDEDEEDEEFWSEQRLSDELDQALEAPPLTDEHEVAPRTDVHEIPAPVADPSAPVQEDEDEEDDAARPDYDPDTGHEDVLEDTPDFLEDAPEDDELWFEQKPPKDFDLD